jgi:hypothetical protein
MTLAELFDELEKLPEMDNPRVVMKVDDDDEYLPVTSVRRLPDGRVLLA